MSNLKRNIGHGVLWQGVSICASFLLVPLSISYLGEIDYGLWIIFYSLLMLITSCDLGLPSSFRNMLTRVLVENDNRITKKLISTAYISLGLLSIIAFLLLLVFKDNPLFNEVTFIPLSLFLSLLAVTLLDFNLKLTLTVYTSHQKALYLPFATALINLLFLFIVFILNSYEIGGSGKLEMFCIVMPLSSLFINILFAIYAYKGPFNTISPSFKCFDMIYLKPLFFSGGGFFLIQVSMAILSQYSNIILFKLSSSKLITSISILDKYFGLISILGAVVLFPFWSQFTKKHIEGDYVWIKNCLKKLEICFFISCFIVFFLWLLFPYFLELWLINQTIDISHSLSAVVAIKYLMILLNSIYSYYLNGIGKINIQIVLYSVGALFIIPMSNFMFLQFNVEGVISYTIFIYLALAMTQKIYITYIIRNKLNA